MDHLKMNFLQQMVIFHYDFCAPEWKKLPKISRWPWNIHLNFNMRYTSTQMVVAFPLACLFSRVYYSTNSCICIHIYFICIVYISICTFIFVCLYVHVCWDASLTLSKNHHLCYTILVWEISIVRGIWISMKQHLSFKQSLNMDTTDQYVLLISCWTCYTLP